ncbi:ACT domain-containing protein [Rhizomonospora bruguierae]|uniref:amino acid-binding protein n=1 Tax=Rhizomonospora bruguierae TaxID=1581705 RepID=UPI001BD10418|nr:amino acid-binding protein [Micromonospora sp. NBRC 107566]
MLLRVRVTLPDRPGALGQVARTLGVAGADIVQVVVLERLGGRAVDDFTVVWPGSARVERLMAGLAAVPGVRVDGLWRTIGAPIAGGHEAELLAQLASGPADGLATLVDAVPGLLAADWAAALAVPPDWAERPGARRTGPVPTVTATRATVALPDVGLDAAGANAPADRSADRAFAGLVAGGGLHRHPWSRSEPTVAYASWRAPEPLPVPDVTPLRARAIQGPDGTRYAAAPFGRGGLVLLVARAEGGLPVPAFHATEVDRAALLVRAAAVILGDRLASVGAPPAAT